MARETVWTFEAGAGVPEWLMRQTNCTLTFDRDVVVVDRGAAVELYPAAAMALDQVMILAEVVNRHRAVDVEHVRPIIVHTAPRAGSVN
ncbi:MAG TPA: hypothetical protein VF601_05035 [Beijerinckiaceae bacterium]|jgi:hypothetical protein